MGPAADSKRRTGFKTRADFKGRMAGSAAKAARYSAHAIEFRFQGTASTVAYTHLEEAVKRRRELGQKLRAIREADGPLPLT